MRDAVAGSAKVYSFGQGGRLTMVSRHKDFLVGAWRVSPKLNQISKGGRTVTVKHKSMAVLVCLADARGDVLSRNDIMDQVWPGMAVTDDVLTQSIVELRKAFDDDARHPDIIETIFKVGFRLVATVREVPGAVNLTAAPQTAWRYLIAGLALLGVGVTLWFFLGRPESARQPVTTAEESPSIAVLPFANITADPDQDHFSHGLSDDVRILLGNVPNLKVIGRTSSFAFIGKNEDLRSIGERLGVATVLEGSVRKLKDRVRIAVHLIDVSDGAEIWSENYERTITTAIDIFDITDDVSNAIIAALQIHVGAAPTRGRPTESQEAYVLFLKARASINLGESRDGVNSLHKAIELDPDFAEAYEMLAWAYWWDQAEGAVTLEEAQKLTGAAAAEALARDPDLVFARALHLSANLSSDVFLDLIEAYEQAVLEGPTNQAAINALTYDLMESGYVVEAVRFAEQLVELDPLSVNANFLLVTALYAAGQTMQAAEANEALYELNSRPADWLMGNWNLARKQDDIAISHFEASLQQGGLPSHWVREFVTSARDPFTGQAYLDRRIPQIISTMPEENAFWMRKSLTTWYLFFGFLDRYFEIILDHTIAPGAWSDADEIVWRGTLYRHLGFTAHPKYLEAAELVDIVEVWEQRGAPDFCEKVEGHWVCE